MSKKIAIAVVCILILSAVGFLGIFIPIHNDHIASEIEHTLLETPLPENTEVIESVNVAGKLTGNGNGMNFFGGMLIKTELTEDELEQFYSEIREYGFEYLIVNQNSDKISVIEHGDYNFESLKNVTDFDRFYLIYTWGSDNSALKNFGNFDLRGH